MNGVISVIIPAYNDEKYIDICLKSIINQTYQNFEIILVDDESCDETASICMRYTEEDARIKFFKINHQGPSAARNKGLIEASGEYITFLDADDYIEPDTFEKYNDIFTKYGDKIAFASTGMVWDRILSQGVKFESYSLDLKDISNTAEGYYLLARDYVAKLLESRLFISVVNKCYKTDIIKEKNLTFECDKHIAEDMLFNLEYLRDSSGLIGYINESAYHYVKHGTDSLTSKYFDGSIDAVKGAFRKLLDFVSEEPSDSRSLMIIEKVYLFDWLSRITALWDDKSYDLSKKEKIKVGKEAIKSDEFQDLLSRVRSAGGIGFIKYIMLRNNRYELYCFLRDIYMCVKRVGI